MFKTIQEFASSWKQESAATARVFDALTDASLAQAVGPDDRTLGRIAFHIVLTIPEMLGRTGLYGAMPPENEAPPVPTSAAALAAQYREYADDLLARVEAQWTDASLLIEDDMYGQKWPRGLTLGVLIHHEIHHRGQMTVLMRQAGLTVPGVYGPSREEWANFGMTAPAI